MNACTLFRHFAAVFSLSSLTVPLCAQSLEERSPIWWSTAGTSIWSGTPTQWVNTNNSSPINTGQLKHVASMAKIYLDAKLAAFGGAGPEITALVNGLEGKTGSSASQRAENAMIANAGQLKRVGDLYYRRLYEIGVNAATDVGTRFNCSANVSVRTGKPYSVPWLSNAPAPENAAAATVGQFKVVFGFEVEGNLDTDADGLPDGWEQRHFGNLTSQNASGDPDGDGLNNLDELDLGLDPNVFESASAGLRANYTYDLVGRLTNAASPELSTAFSVDEEGNILNAQ